MTPTPTESPRSFSSGTHEGSDPPSGGTEQPAVDETWASVASGQDGMRNKLFSPSPSSGGGSPRESGNVEIMEGTGNREGVRKVAREKGRLKVNVDTVTSDEEEDEDEEDDLEKLDFDGEPLPTGLHMTHGTHCMTKMSDGRTCGNDPDGCTRIKHAVKRLVAGNCGDDGFYDLASGASPRADGRVDGKLSTFRTVDQELNRIHQANQEINQVASFMVKEDQNRRGGGSPWEAAGQASKPTVFSDELAELQELDPTSPKKVKWDSNKPGPGTGREPARDLKPVMKQLDQTSRVKQERGVPPMKGTVEAQTSYEELFTQMAFELKEEREKRHAAERLVAKRKTKAAPPKSRTVDELTADEIIAMAEAVQEKLRMSEQSGSGSESDSSRGSGSSRRRQRNKRRGKGRPSRAKRGHRRSNGGSRKEQRQPSYCSSSESGSSSGSEDKSDSSETMDYGVKSNPTEILEHAEIIGYTDRTPSSKTIASTKRWYMILRGRKIGIVGGRWEDVGRQLVDGFPNNSYKSFSTYEAARNHWTASWAAHKKQNAKRKKERRVSDFQESSSDSRRPDGTPDLGPHPEVRTQQTRDNIDIKTILKTRFVGTDPSTKTDEICGTNVNSEIAAYDVMVPPGVTAETGRSMLNAAIDVFSLPGKNTNAGSSGMDSAAEVVQELAKAMVEGIHGDSYQVEGRVRADPGFNNASRNYLVKITNLDAL